jgi:hypothetical protein
MTRIAPTLIPGAGINKEEDRYEHPAFGFIRLNRVQGGDPHLFMSNVRHQNKVTICIGRATMARRHHLDTHYAREEEISIEMTTVQFADLMAGLGQGGGVPCTIRKMRGPDGRGPDGNGAYLPGIDMENTAARYSKEVADTFKKRGQEIDDLVETVRSALDAAKVSKTKQAEILGPIQKLARDLGANMPFMADMFKEAVEGMVQEAKAVVEAYAVDRGITAVEAPALLGQAND